jgi:hypothetical protein
LVDVYTGIFRIICAKISTLSISVFIYDYRFLFNERLYLRTETAAAHAGQGRVEAGQGDHGHHVRRSGFGLKSPFAYGSVHELPTSAPDVSLRARKLCAGIFIVSIRLF